MMISHYTLESTISFDENEINYLVVEDQRQMARYITDINNGIENQNSGFVLSDENDILDLSKHAEIIIDPFTLEPNSPATVNILLQRMRNNALGDNQLKTDEMLSMINSTIGNIVNEQHPSVSFSENLDIMKLFKFLGVRFNHLYDDMLESICEYLTIKRDYSSIKLFIFVNLRCFLNLKFSPDIGTLP